MDNRYLSDADINLFIFGHVFLVDIVSTEFYNNKILWDFSPNLPTSWGSLTNLVLVFAL
jgi:hypothetical protein